MINNDASNLSIVIQGPLNNKIFETIDNYLLTYPALEIILMVWYDNKEFFLSPLKRIENKVNIFYLQDPGGQVSFVGEKMNVNRQLVSTKKGINNSNREYCLKSRSDFEINLKKTITFYNKHQRDSKLNQFKKSILIINLTTVNPFYNKRFFAFCDWLYLGLTIDLQNLLISDLFPETYLNEKIVNKSSLRYNAEQWMILKGILGNNFEHIMKNSYDCNEEIENIYKKTIQTFIIANTKKLGLKSFKYKVYNFGLWRMYSFKEWKKEYYSNYHYTIDLDRLKFNLLKFVFYLKMKLT